MPIAKLLAPALAAVVLHAALLVAYVVPLGRDPAVLVCVGSDRIGRPPYEAVRVPCLKDGYDGQYYYAIARSPWGIHREGIDAPALRHSRILYPLACWILSAGNVHVLPWAMPAVNLIAVAGLAAMGAAVAMRYGLSPWYGFLLPIAANAALPSLRDLSDVTSTCATCALLVTWLIGGRTAAMTLAAAAALFAREQNAAIVLLIFAAAAYRGRWREAVGLALALALWSGWLLVLRLAYGKWPLAVASGNVGFPGRGLLYLLQYIARSRWRADGLVNAACLLLLLLQAGLAVYLLRTSADRVTVLVALAGVALGAVASIPVYEDKWSYMRVLNWLPLGCWLGCVQARLPKAAIAMSIPALLLPLGAVARAWIGSGIA
jgi:hypothetical protein